MKALNRKNVKMLAVPLDMIMNRLIAGSAGRAIQSLGVASEIKVDLPLIRLEPNFGYLPRILKTQGCCEKRG